MPSPAEPPVAPASSSRWTAGAVGFYRTLRANPLTFAGFVLVVLLVGTAVVVAAAPALLVPYAAGQVSTASNVPPTLLHWPPSFVHPFGTDQAGIDVYSEVMLALPLDLGIGITIAGFALLVGGALGLVAGYWDRPGTLGGVASVTILRLTDVFLAFPSLLLGLAIVAAFGAGITQAILAVLLTWWPYYVRLVRGEVLAVKHLGYVTAARAAGVRESRILLRHVLRNVLEPAIVYFTLDIGTVLVVFSTIAFVVPGVIRYPVPPEWGSMLSFFQRDYVISQVWWEIAFPGGAIFLAALSFSLLGDGLRDVLDPRSRRALVRATAGSSASPAVAAARPEVPSVSEGG